ncbi:MAG: anthranilate synthase component I [Nitrospirae bacterium]|nr:anthranilate synthase component I [Nitrospirota bacterium]
MSSQDLTPFIQPGEKEFARLAAEFTVVPVWQEIVADLETPVAAYQRLVGDAPGYLLESVEGEEQWGRYSIIGLEPSLLLRSAGGSTEISDGRTQRRIEGSPLDALRKQMQGLRQAPHIGLPRFTGGAVGFFSYDVVRHLERLPDRTRDDLRVPDAYFFVGGPVVVFDRFRQRATLLVNVAVRDGARPSALYAAALRTLQRLRRRLEVGRGPGRARTARLAEPRVNMARPEFERIVKRAKEYIVQGDAIQVVLSRRFEFRSPVDPYTVYRALRMTNPSPYMFYLNFGDLRLIGSSPEILVRVEGESVVARPIAGTRPRGRSVVEDARLEEELRSDPKEKAEHIMLVDLGRNDVGRVAAQGSVAVSDLMSVERYSTVMHLVTSVQGKLADGRDGYDAFSACFPAGTVSGAPKVRAMEIIEELEPTRRGFYAGSVGYFSFSGAMDMCITIRTLLHRAGRYYIQAGAGIVADSQPDREFHETESKALGVRRALEMACKGLVPGGPPR